MFGFTSISISSIIYKDSFLSTQLCSGETAPLSEWRQELLINLSHTVLHQKEVWALTSHLNSHRLGILSLSVKGGGWIIANFLRSTVQNPLVPWLRFPSPSLLGSGSGGSSPSASPGWYPGTGAGQLSSSATLSSSSPSTSTFRPGSTWGVCSWRFVIF